MPCYHPLEAAKVEGEITFNPSKFAYGLPLKLPCGQCVGCRLERSRQWAVRCYHEASLYSDNCFITLTYNDKTLPKDGSLQLRHFQLFMKRLRKHFGAGIRFYHCGEYGDTFGRPHYHACLFNFDFPDKVLWKIINDQRLYRSTILEELWPYGYSSVGSVTFESAAYVARYIMKKVNGQNADKHYADPHTGLCRKPEYTTMSRRPGIGRGWFEKYTSDVYPSDNVVVNGRKMRPPRYYDNLYEIIDPAALEEIKFNREENSKLYLDDNTQERLNVKEQVTLASISRLPRVVD